MTTLREIVRKNGEKQYDVAKLLGITESTLCWKMDGKSDFKQSEIAKLAEHYGLSAEQIQEVFFTA